MSAPDFLVVVREISAYVFKYKFWDAKPGAKMIPPVERVDGDVSLYPRGFKYVYYARAMDVSRVGNLSAVADFRNNRNRGITTSLHRM